MRDSCILCNYVIDATFQKNKINKPIYNKNQESLSLTTTQPSLFILKPTPQPFLIKLSLHMPS